MFCFRTQRTQRSQRFYYITLSLEGSLATRDKSAQRLAKTSNCLLYSFAILPLRPPVVAGNYANHEPEATDTDRFAIDNGYISITPIQIDMTDYPLLEEMKGWNLECDK